MSFVLNSPLSSGAVMSNQTSSGDPNCDWLFSNRYIVPTLYFLILPIGLVLNGVAAWVSLHLPSNNTFVVFLKNLVAADLIMTLLIPIRAANDLPGASNTIIIISCKFFSPLFYSVQYTSITLLGLIGVDRFFKIMCPHNKLGQNLTFSKVLSGSIWVVLFGSMALPNIILSNKPVVNRTDTVNCMVLKEPVGLDFHQGSIIFVMALFWLVSVVITICYICITRKVIQSFKNSASSNTRGQQRIKLRVFLVLIVFLVSFVPYHIVRIPYTIMQVNRSSQIYCFYLKIKFAKDLTLWLANTNICLDPLLYVFLCREFKEKLLSMMERVFHCIRVASPGKVEPSPPHGGLQDNGQIKVMAINHDDDDASAN